MRAQIKTKVEEIEFTLFLTEVSWDINLLLPLVFPVLSLHGFTAVCSTGSLGSQGFRFGLKLHLQLSWTSSLKIADHGTSQPLLLHELIPHNKSLSIYLYLSCWFRFSAEP